MLLYSLVYRVMEQQLARNEARVHELEKELRKHEQHKTRVKQEIMRTQGKVKHLDDSDFKIKQTVRSLKDEEDEQVEDTGILSGLVSSPFVSGNLRVVTHQQYYHITNPFQQEEMQNVETELTELEETKSSFRDTYSQIKREKDQQMACIKALIPDFQAIKDNMSKCQVRSIATHQLCS